MWGPLVSGIFLLLIGVLNLVSLVGIWRVLRGMRDGRFDEQQLEEQLSTRGLLSRVLGPVTRWVDEPWKMYPVGVLFGLGFDTATTVALFVIGGGAAIAAPWYVVMVLPILFTGGMTLFDTLDGVVMHRAYQWAYRRPVRKVYYNVTITMMSIAVAFLVGGVVLAGLIAEQAHVRSGPLSWLAQIDLEHFGFVIVGVLLATWLASLAYWKLARMEARYGALE